MHESRDCFAALAMTDPPTPPEKHPGKGEETALKELLRNNTAVPQQGNDDFLAQGKYFPLQRAS
jgi:hypothetical protein